MSDEKPGGMNGRTQGYVVLATMAVSALSAHLAAKGIHLDPEETGALTAGASTLFGLIAQIVTNIFMHPEKPAPSPPPATPPPEPPK